MDTTQWVVVGIGMAALVAGIIFIVLGVLAKRKLSVMADTRTVGAGEAAHIADPSGTAKVEVYGVAEAREPLTAPVSGKQCVYFRHQVEELRVEYDRDSQGNRQRRESWHTITDEKRHTQFTVRDSTGAVQVNPEKADFVPQKTVDNAYGAPGYEPGARSGLGGVVGGVVGDVIGSALGGERSAGIRSSEWIVPVGQQTYVIGNARQTPSGPVLCKGEGHFMISYKSEEELARKFRLAYILWMVFGIALGAGGITAAIIAATVMGEG
jgi:hypothetical protein